MPEDTKSPYRMRIDLSVLDHLGINLYSNIPSVLSEAVANAWDADAENVQIEMTDGAIIIQDDGVGMSLNDINNRFLLVGYKRRKNQKGETPKGRQPMGRKGIGKLSLFSIAKTVEVHTCKRGKKNAFRMTIKEIRKAKKNSSKDYYAPEKINFDKNYDISGSGTRIVLRNLKKSYTEGSHRFLLRRLARRFSVIGEKYKFRVSLNGKQISPSDRGYYKDIQYIWTYGKQTDVLESCSNKEDYEDRSDKIDRKNLDIRGWIATVTHPRNLKEETEQGRSENLNRIAIYVRGKMAQEDLLSEFSQANVYTDYIIGEIHVDAMDVDSKPDAATSSRQKIMEDDSRYDDLKEAIQGELIHIKNHWRELRRKSGIKRTRKNFPAVAAWIDSLHPKSVRKKAERWIGRLNQIRSDDDETYKSLLQHAILGFEKFRHRYKLEELEKIQDENLDAILKMFEGIDELEYSYYGQIVETRLEVIRAFEDLVSEDKQEIIIRKHIFKHLWLLDPSWERIDGTEYTERTIGKILKKNTATLKKEEKRARIDIGYRTVAGKHVIVELKRPSARLMIGDLMEQIRKYRDAVKDKIISGGHNSDWPLEIVCVLGKAPGGMGAGAEAKAEDLRKSLKAVDARPVYYDELIRNAHLAYAAYFKKHREHDKLWQIFQDPEDFSLSESS